MGGRPWRQYGGRAKSIYNHSRGSAAVVGALVFLQVSSISLDRQYHGSIDFGSWLVQRVFGWSVVSGFVGGVVGFLVVLG